PAGAGKERLLDDHSAGSVGEGKPADRAPLDLLAGGRARARPRHRVEHRGRSRARLPDELNQQSAYRSDDPNQSDSSDTSTTPVEFWCQSWFPVTVSPVALP